MTISIDKAGAIYVNDQPASYEQLTPRVLAMTNGETDRSIYIRGASETDYGPVAQVLGKLSSSGFTKITMVTDPMGKGQAVSAASSSGGASF